MWNSRKQSLFYFISLTGCYYKQSMLHSAVNISFNLLIFFPASPKSYFMILSLFPFQNMRYHYNTIKQKKKKNQVIYGISLSILFSLLIFLPPWIYIKTLMDIFGFWIKGRTQLEGLQILLLKNPKASLKVRVGPLFI